MSDGKEGRLCWIINITTDTHGKVLKIIESLYSNVHKSTNPVIEGTNM